jgi:hypothetical protein
VINKHTLIIDYVIRITYKVILQAVFILVEIVLDINKIV